MKPYRSLEVSCMLIYSQYQECSYISMHDIDRSCSRILYVLYEKGQQPSQFQGAGLIRNAGMLSIVEVIFNTVIFFQNTHIDPPWLTCEVRVNWLRPSDAYICLSEQDHHWFRWWLVAWPAPSHYLNQCWVIVNWTLRNKLRWNLNQNLCIFIQENALENVLWKIAVILSQPQCVKGCLCELRVRGPSQYKDVVLPV